ncbi:MAG: hypothetical protein HY329_14805 [Chloroflexi bacterium]|nr:hypothetical protein [Chloroflexota bacterium]
MRLDHRATRRPASGRTCADRARLSWCRLLLVASHALLIALVAACGSAPPATGPATDPAPAAAPPATAAVPAAAPASGAPPTTASPTAAAPAPAKKSLGKITWVQPSDALLYASVYTARGKELFQAEGLEVPSPTFPGARV